MSNAWQRVIRGPTSCTLSKGMGITWKPRIAGMLAVLSTYIARMKLVVQIILDATHVCFLIISVETNVI
jgi:hypothetical protein